MDFISVFVVVLTLLPMKSKHYGWLLTIVVILAWSVFPAKAQEVNTQGRDFWVSFLPNWPNSVPKLEILVAGDTPCTGVATNPRTGWSTRFSVTPGAVTSVVIPNSEGLMVKENTVEYKAIHVTTTEDVSLYASNFDTATYDVSNVLPTAILQENYLAQAFSAGKGHPVLSSKMLIVGIENGTEITIDPKGGLKGYFPSSSKKRITLNAGECFLFISASGDITGTAVNVTNGKKVAVFSGGDTQIPFDGCCYDAVFEQSIPLAYWGRHFVVTASKERKNDIVRILSLAPGCQISIDGKYRKTLGARQYYDYKLNGESKEAIYISASSPVSVCLFLTSATMGGEMGDPSMVNINPIEQQMDKVTFATYNTAVSRFHYVNIVMQTRKVQNLTLDGASVASEFKPVPYKEGLSYARIDVAHGSHTLESSEGGFVAHIYGLGPYESYAYSVGSSSRVLNEFDEKGNLIISNIPDDIEEEETEEDVVVVVDTTANGGEEEVADTTANGAGEIVKPVYSPTDTLSKIDFGNIRFTELERGDRIRGILEDQDNQIVSPHLFDISAEADPSYLFEDIEVTFEADTVVLALHPRGSWCDCFIPDQVHVNMVLTPKEEGADKIILSIPVSVAEKESWIRRCIWVIILIGALVLLLLYLLAMIRKKRFKKSAMLIPVYYDRYGNEIDDGAGQKLRKPGFFAWVSRWFIPGTEKRSMSFSDPSCVISVVASSEPNKVEIPKKSIDPITMDVDGYDPQNDAMPSRPVELDSVDRIYIRQTSGKMVGYLYFVPGDENDGGGFRLLLIVMAMAAALAIVVLTFLMIKGLL